MKTIPLALLAIATLATSAVAQVPVSPASIDVGKIQVTAPNTPEFQILGGQAKRFKTLKWLEIETEFAVKAKEIDELTFKYTVLMERQLLTAEVTYVNMLESRENFAVMYISPKAIEKLTGGKPLTSNALDNVWVEVTRQGQVLGRTSLKPGAIPNAPQVAGMILNKNDTPFSVLYYDRYPTIKPTR